MKQFYFLKYVVPLCIVFSSAVTAFCQSGSISGIVRDEANQPLVGASVVLQETSLATRTDVAGRYHFAGLAAGKYTLVVSYIGYQEVTQEVEVGVGTEVDIQMTPSSTELSQVVVIGYGTQRKRDGRGLHHHQCRLKPRAGN